MPLATTYLVNGRRFAVSRWRVDDVWEACASNVHVFRMSGHAIETRKAGFLAFDHALQVVIRYFYPRYLPRVLLKGRKERQARRRHGACDPGVNYRP